MTLPLEALTAMLVALARSRGAPEATIALLIDLARDLHDAITKHAAGEPLPEILRAACGDDAALVAALIERDLGEGGDRTTWPGPAPEGGGT